MSYYVNRDGRQYGPYTSIQLVQMAREGRFGPTDMVWLDDQKTWKPASEVIGHIVPSAPEPAPPPPDASAPPPELEPEAAALEATPGAPDAAMPSLAPEDDAPPSGESLVSTGPVPPGMHWALVLLLGVLTCGIFPIVWLFIEAGFVKKVDPKSNAILLLVLYFVGIIVGDGIIVAGTLAGRGGELLSLFGGLMVVACVILFFVAIFGMRSSLEQYYNSVEDIRLKLSGIMTFFFSVYYFQHHFKRISDWKQTGRLEPQY